MASFSEIVSMIKLLFSSVFGKYAMASIADLVDDYGKDVVDELTKKAEKRALLLENEYPNRSGSLKRDELLDYLGDEATKLGLSMAASSLNMIIEIVVSNLKARSLLN